MFISCPYCKKEITDLPKWFTDTDQCCKRTVVLLQTQLQAVVDDRQNLMQMNMYLDDMVSTLNDVLGRDYRSGLSTIVIQRM